MIVENLHKSVDELDLSVRAAECLNRAGIETIGELVQKTEKNLLGIRSFGRTSLREIKRKLADSRTVYRDERSSDSSGPM